MKKNYTLLSKVLLLLITINSCCLQIDAHALFTVGFNQSHDEFIELAIPAISSTTSGIDSIMVFQDQSVSCFGFNDGSCQANVFPAGNYTYQLDGGIQSNTIGFFDGLTPGIHTVCVSDGTNSMCDTVLIQEPQALQIQFATDSLVSCLGNDGSLSAVINGGTIALQGYLTYWKDDMNTLLNPSPNNFDLNINGLSVGNYSLTVEDDHGCFYTASTTLTNAAPLLVSATSTNIICYGGTSIITPTSTGGIAPITFAINGMPIQSAYLAGTYTITATDLKGCTNSSTIQVTDPAYITIYNNQVACDEFLWNETGLTYTVSGIYSQTNINNEGCTFTNELNLTINHSTTSNVTVAATDSYTWNDNMMTYTLSGIYTSTSVNNEGCLHTSILNLTLTYSHLTLLNAYQDQTVSCFGFDDGSTQAIPQPAGNYTYELDGNVATNLNGFFDHLSPGMHTVCATDGTYTICDTVLITQPDPLQIQFVIDSLASCQNNDGQLTAIISGGTTFLQPYLTNWTDASNSLLNPSPNNFDVTINGLGAGVYSLSIEDDHGCFLSQSTVLGNIPSLLVSATSSIIPCYGGSGIISASSTGGTWPIVYLVNGLPLQVSYTSGTYTVTAIDAKNCSSETIIVLTEPAYITNTFATTACDSFTWNETGLTYTMSGVYTNTSTNSFGCQMSNVLNLTIHQSSISTSTIAAIDNYTWADNGMTYTLSGQYTFTSLNNDACVHTSVLDLTITYSHLTILTAYQDQNISCYGYNDGSSQAVPQPAGNYTYILDGGVQQNTTGFFDLLTPGIHSICATDGLYTVCDTVLITEPDALQIQFVVDSLSSCLNDGAISANVSGGTTFLQPYLTTWTDASNNIINPAPNNFSLSVSNLPEGNYALKIEDDHGCFLTQSVMLGSSQPLIVSAMYSPIICHGGTTSIAIVVAGGSGNVNTFVNGVSMQSNYLAGSYTITAVDSKGCMAQSILLVTEPSAIVNHEVKQSCDAFTWIVNGNTYTSTGMYTYSNINSLGCVETNTLDLTILSSSTSSSSATSSFSYTWPANGITYTNSGVFTATLTNAVGCDSLLTLTLTITGALVSPKVFLAGPYDKQLGMMSDSLRVMQLIPLNEPYSNYPYNKPQLGEPGGEAINPMMLTITGHDAIVDWIYLEVRSSVNPSLIVSTKRALLQRDGDIVHTDGISPVRFDHLSQGYYYVSVKHRNHLGVMTANPVMLNGSVQAIDFTSATPVYTISAMPYNEARKVIGGNYLLWAGNANNDKNVKYNGLSNEKDAILMAVGNATPNNVLVAYRMEDLNMDGKVKFNQVDNDKNVVLMQVGVSSPNAIISQHLVN